MSGIDGLDMDAVDEIVVKWDQVYIPNKSVCPDQTFSTFEKMKEVIGEKLEAASNFAHENNVPFQPYVVKQVIKPEFAHEVVGYSPVGQTSD